MNIFLAKLSQISLYFLLIQFTKVAFINSKNVASFNEYQVVDTSELLASDLENYDIIDGDVPTPDPDINFEEELGDGDMSGEYETYGEAQEGGGEEGGSSDARFDCTVCDTRLGFCKMMCYTEECKEICVPLYEDCMGTCTCG